ncbi:MAG: hypothetical protein QOK43_1974 [Acidimicrobiaceae bacterium]|nr:hypothetical protein [Acidimicrobiaceae bacterium]
MIQVIGWGLVLSGVLFWVAMLWFIWDEYVPEWRKRWKDYRHRRRLARALNDAALVMEVVALIRGHEAPATPSLKERRGPRLGKQSP